MSGSGRAIIPSRRNRSKSINKVIKKVKLRFEWKLRDLIVWGCCFSLKNMGQEIQSSNLQWGRPIADISPDFRKCFTQLLRKVFVQQNRSLV